MARPSKLSVNADPSLRELIGPALFVDLALATGEPWTVYKQEQAVSARLPPEPLNDASAENGKRFDPASMLKHMLRCRVPDGPNLEKLSAAFPNSRLTCWRNHRYWQLLRYGAVDGQTIESALKALPAQHQALVFFRGTRIPLASRFYAAHLNIDRFCELKDFDALVAVTALARDTRAPNEDNAEACWAAHVARKIFPHVVANTPQLFIRWRHLAIRYERLFWTGNETAHLKRPSGQKDLEDQVLKCAALARSNGVRLPPDSMVKKPIATEPVTALPTPP
jgi:hypothetical protein